MKLLKFIFTILLLTSPLAFCQQPLPQWRSMDGPYYVYDVTGISLGWDGTQIRAYMVASDLDHTFLYSYFGDSPIAGWADIIPTQVDGAKHVSASRQNGLRAYATVPEQDGIDGHVLYTINGGANWDETPSQPGNKAFTCIETHPGNPEICFTGAELIGGDVASVWRTTTGGDSWSEIRPQGIDARNTVRAIHIDPNSGNTIEQTIIYVCYNNEGIWRGYNGGLGKWENISVSNNEQAIDIAIEYNLSNNLYVIGIKENTYELWHSFDNGNKWESVRDFGGNRIKGIAAAKLENIENIWALAADTIFYSHKDLSGQNWLSLAARDGDTLQCLSIDCKNPNQAYVGSKHNIEWISVDRQNIIRRTIAEGTNYNGPIKEEWK